LNPEQNDPSDDPSYQPATPNDQNPKNVSDYDNPSDDSEGSHQYDET
jgi:hypothetical protein